MIWFRIGLDVGLFVLDVTWWIIAIRLVKNPFWRLLISLFMAAQTAAIFTELFGRLGFELVDFSRCPTFVLVAMNMWHYFALPAMTGLGAIFMGVKLIRWKSRKKSAGEKLPPAPIASVVVNRRQFIGSCAALAPPLFTFGLTGIAMNQLSEFRLRRFTLAIPSLPRDLDGLTIANVSDIHVGEWTHGPVLQKIVEATNALHADMVILTGDLINYELSDLSEALSLVKKMPGRYGVWMVEGNHDLLQDGREFEHRVKVSGVPLLLDESVVVMVRGYPVQLFGLRWMDLLGSHLDRVMATQLAAAMTHRQPDAFPILLAHHPHAFDAARAAGLPLTLTGHTHGGQLMLDKNIGVGPILFRYWSGLYQRGPCQTIVSNGVGNTFPLRINAPAEIVHVTLRCA